MTKTILLADDSVTIQKVIELTFMDEDYEVATAGNGEEALERLEEVTPDVVIADVHMPGASGFDVAKRAKQLHPDTPVLLLVGTFEPFDEADYQASGADSYLKKPFDSQELLQRVGSLLEASPRAASEAPAPAAETPAAAEPSPFAAAPTESLLPPIDGGGDEEAVSPAPAAQEETPWSAATSQASQVAPPADLAETRAVPGLAAGERVEPMEEQAEPFPELGSRPSAARGGGGIFSGLGFDEGDGSTEVPPPPDLADEGPAATAAPAPPAPPTSTPAPPAPAAAPAGEVPSSGVSAPAPAVAPAAAGLSDADVDRIARRVAELLGDGVLREVAWEVVPDLAEVVIKERLRELEGQVVD